MRLMVDQLALAAMLLAAMISATPMAKQESKEEPKKDTFSVRQSRSKSSAARRSGPAGLRHAYNKYNMHLPKDMRGKKGAGKQKSVKQKSKASKADSSAAGGVGSVVATPSDPTDNEYVSTVLVGGQKVHVNFDTGSSDFWVFSSELSSKAIGNHSIYNPSKSETSSKLEGASWNISYGDSSAASGDVYIDTVSIGGAVAKKQAVELASNVSDQFVTDYASGGLLGLGFDSINTVSPDPQKTFFTNIRPSLAEPLFAVDLNHNAPGTYDFGFINSKKYTGDIQYLPVDNSQGFWGVTSTSYGVGDSSDMKDRSINAIVDTGTTLLLVPKRVLKAYYRQVDGAKNSRDAGGYIFPCDTTLPDFLIGFGDYTAVVPGSAINNSVIDGTNCYGGIQWSPPDSGPEGIYGDVFLKSSFVVFKYPEDGKPEIGFAAKGSDGSAKPTPTQSAPSSASSSSSDSNILSEESDDEDAEDADEGGNLDEPVVSTVSAKSAKADKSPGSEKSAKSETPKKPAKSAKSNKEAKPEKSTTSEASDKPRSKFSHSFGPFTITFNRRT